MHTAYIGMGANLLSPAGSPEATLAAAVLRLGSLGRVRAKSSLYSTEPVGFADQPRFVNAVAALETEMAPHELLDRLLEIEREFGRDRSAGVQNGPRTLDLDILLIDGLCIHEAALEIPHPRLAERAFVLLPLNEIAPSIRDPRTGMTVTELLRRLFPDSRIKSTVNSKVTHNEIFKLESDLWRAGSGDAGGGRGKP